MAYFKCGIEESAGSKLPQSLTIRLGGHKNLPEVINCKCENLDKSVCHVFFSHCAVSVLKYDMNFYSVLRML